MIKITIPKDKIGKMKVGDDFHSLGKISEMKDLPHGCEITIE